MTLLGKISGYEKLKKQASRADSKKSDQASGVFFNTF